MFLNLQSTIPGAGLIRINMKYVAMYNEASPGVVRMVLLDDEAMEFHADIHEVDRWVTTNFIPAKVGTGDSLRRKTGANGIQEGDRVQQGYRHGTAGEFFPDGDVEVHWYDGTSSIVKVPS